MKRLIMTSPAGLTLDQLTPEQQEAVQSVFAQFVLPMPCTKEYDGRIIIDSVTKDNFNPDVIIPLGLPFNILGMWQWTGNNADELLTLQSLSPEFINYLPNINSYNQEGNIISTTPPTLTIPHNWSGWADVVL